MPGSLTVPTATALTAKALTVTMLIVMAAIVTAAGLGVGPGGGFAAGGVLDQMLPGAELGCYLAAARRAGFGRLSDYELCGVIAAYDRQTSCDTAGQLAAIAELDARRAGPAAVPASTPATRSPRC